MDRQNWMYDISRSTPEYLKGVQTFLVFAETNRASSGARYIWCPCKDCKNVCKFNTSVIEGHLIKRGFMHKYTCWSQHGELLTDKSTFVSVSNNQQGTSSYSNNDHEDLSDNNNIPNPVGVGEDLSEMFHNLERTVGDDEQEKLQKLFQESEKELYPGCTKYSILDFVLKLLNLKADSGWSDSSFTRLLEFLHDSHPQDNGIPVSLYQAKKLMCPMGLEIERIHACPNDCILYRKEYKDLHECVTCGHQGINIKKKHTKTMMLRKMVPPLNCCGICQSYRDLKDYLPMRKRPNYCVGIMRNAKRMESWLKEKVLANNGQPIIDKIVKQLGEGPNDSFKSYQAYEINGYVFYTQTQDEKSINQNSGVTLIASTTENNRIAKESYYGVIQEIWELDYSSFTIPLFKCKWVCNEQGVNVDERGFTLVDLATDSYASEPFILAKLATQVFFVKDPIENSRWHVVLQSKRRILGVDDVVDEDEYDPFDELPPFSVGIPHG